MNIGLVILFLLIFSYILIPPILKHEPYLDAVRERYRKILGGEWTRKKSLIVEAGAILIVICLVVLLTYLTAR